MIIFLYIISKHNSIIIILTVFKRWKKTTHMLVDQKRNILMRLLKRNSNKENQKRVEKHKDPHLMKEHEGYWTIWRLNKETGGESVESICIDNQIAQKELTRLKIDKPEHNFKLRAF